MSHLRHPIARVRGLGSAKDGAHQWWMQRLTAIALALLTPWFLVVLACHAGGDAAALRASLAQPLNAGLMLGFALALYWHAFLGLQVVVEDYIHVRWLEVTLMVALRFVFAAAAISTLLAIGRLVFTA